MSSNVNQPAYRLSAIPPHAVHWPSLIHPARIAHSPRNPSGDHRRPGTERRWTVSRKPRQVWPRRRRPAGACGDTPAQRRFRARPGASPARRPHHGTAIGSRVFQSVGHGVLGGVFALNGHDPRAAGRPGVPGQMTCFAPDTSEWEAMETGHSVWISRMLSGRLETFYEGLRRPGWREEAAALQVAVPAAGRARGGA
ncbi:DUF2625 family protein [Streptomyces sp. SP18CS02]|uniref:DUF2625 family protein n=1 Tax=Streptomyces sp. SP18CS02 TaxID=3002531 RepID=UPI002E7831BB|nr:DUF2625 family protein [Streptomyces sp. SP18CS02]MEE1753052.1 DUF2625 family protein [Streptomyces sp. SP18CS02]